MDTGRHPEGGVRTISAAIAGARSNKAIATNAVNRHRSKFMAFLQENAHQVRQNDSLSFSRLLPRIFYEKVRSAQCSSDWVLLVSGFLHKDMRLRLHR